MLNVLLANDRFKRVNSSPLRPLLLALMLTIAVVAGISCGFAATKAGVEVGDKAPDFTLRAQDGADISLKDFLGKKNVVLYFYPKDDSVVCTKEACSFRDSYKAFTDAGAEVLGVSSDKEKSHSKFADKHHLPFKLLSDSDGSVRKLYGVPKTLKMVPGRVTYVIDKSGIVRLTFNSQINAEKHVEEALRVLKELDKS
jgi:peroxiredoxin Q/BCP